jgi:non-specific serine/threonine protein kinase/serine/threonine-protein kinase
VTPETGPADARWGRLKDLFDGALAVEPERRAAWLHDACGADPTLVRDVFSLLASHEGAGRFLERPALEGGLNVAASEEGGEDLSGRRIGPYEVLALIGRGGMGAVYRAQRADEAYHQVVALKVVRRGTDTDTVLDRFHAERRILARLEHPHIARLLDGGALDDGRPYFVMEHVDGERIDRWAARRQLDTRARLGLFLDVCAAVSHAHRALVVHRDLKPANILVTAEGVVKLLDFGIAKLLDPSGDAEPTATALVPLTPEYASPEQVRGEAVTTSADVYSLGVVLYELLTGRRPYALRQRHPSALLRVICEEEPERPSTAAGRGGEGEQAPPETRQRRRRELSGDLDGIVLMALRKEPARRYSSVEQMAEDVRSHLEGRPVRARPDTFAYRAGKFVRRHRVGVASAAVVALSVAGGITATLWQAHVARRERARAERRFQDVRHLASAFLFEFHDAVERLPGSTPARQLVVRKGLEYLDRLAAEAGGDLSLQRELASAYLKVGDVQGRPAAPNLGDVAGAARSYEQALAIRRALAARDPADLGLRLELAEAHARLGEALAQSRRIVPAVEQHRRAAELAGEALAAEPSSARASLLAAGEDIELGQLLARTGDHAGAKERLDAGLRRVEALAAGAEGDPERTLAVARLLTALSSGLRSTQQTPRALETLRRALSLLEGLAREHRDSAAYRRQLGRGHQVLGDALSFSGAMREAMAHYQQALALFDTLSRQDPANAEARRDLATSYLRLGMVLRNTAPRQKGALEHYREGLAIAQSLAAADPANYTVRRDVRLAQSGIGLVLLSLGDKDGALEAYVAATAEAEALAADDPGNAQFRQDLMAAYNDLGKAQETLGRLAEAVETYRNALDLGAALARSDPANLTLQDDLSWSHGRLADALMNAGDHAAALDHYQQAVKAAAVLAGASGRVSLHREYTAWWEKKAGDAHAARAARAAGAGAQAGRGQACDAYRRSQETLRDIQATRPLSNWAVRLPGELSSALARCGREPGRRPAP